MLHPKPSGTELAERRVSYCPRHSTAKAPFWQPLSTPNCPQFAPSC